jgi:hypothetical protein
LADLDALERLSARVDELLDRVARLEEPLGGTPAATDGARFWALEAVRERAAGSDGRVVFAGVADVAGGLHYEWQEEHDAAALRDGDWGGAAEALRALGHPVRLMLLQAVLGGAHTVRALEALPGLGTTGQIYHHLRELQRAGWLSLARRNHYEVAGERVVPLLVALAAAGLRGGGSR